MRTHDPSDALDGLHGAVMHRPRRRGLRWMASLIAGVALLSLSWPAVPTLGAQTLPGLSRYLVLPFENASRDPRLLWLGEASALLLTEGLVEFKIPAITREDRVRAFDRLRVPTTAALSHATVIRLGELVGATQVVVGTTAGSDDELIVRARSIRLDTGRISEEIVERGPLNDLFAIHDRVARRLATDSPLTSERPADVPAASVFELYVKGLLAEAPATRLAFLGQALASDPAFHRVRLALWDAQTDAGDHQRALAVVRPVPVEDRFWRQAQFKASLSMLSLGQYQGAYEVLTTLNDARAATALLNNLGVIRLRRPIGGPGGRAVAFFQEALRLSPQNSDVLFNLGYAYWLDQDTGSAVSWLREAVRRNPADDAAHYVLGVALEKAGGGIEAAREKDLARRLSSDYEEWESGQVPAGSQAPSGLERRMTEIDTPATTLVEDAILVAGQRDRRELATYHLEAGRRAFQAGRDAAAVAELERAIYLSPYQAEAHLLLGRVHERGRRLDDAIAAFKISIWSQDTEEARMALAEACVAAGDDETARAELQTILGRQSSNVEARRLLEQIDAR